MCATKCRARASSSSGWTGGLARLRSSGGSASPLPKNWAQTQLAVGPGEVRVVGRRHPVGQGLARVVALGDRHGLAVEQSGLGRAAGCGGARPGPSGLIVTIGPCPSSPRRRPPALDLGEEGGQAEVIVLRPDVERVVVALGAAHPEAEEPLGRLLGRDLGVGAVEGVVDRPAARDRSGRPRRSAARGPSRPRGCSSLRQLVDPGLVAVGAVAVPRRADLEHVAELDPPERGRIRGSPAARSTSLARLSGSVSARNSRTSLGRRLLRRSGRARPGAGTRRRSPAGWAGPCSDSSRLNSSSSMKFAPGQRGEVEVQVGVDRASPAGCVTTCDW